MKLSKIEKLEVNCYNNIFNDLTKIINKYGMFDYNTLTTSEKHRHNKLIKLYCKISRKLIKTLKGE